MDTNTSDYCTEHSISVGENLEFLQRELQEAAGLSELFKVLADETRTRILSLLAKQELCGCDLSYLLEMSTPAISHHLRLLKMMRLVSYRREGKQVFYRLNDEHVSELIEVAKAHYLEGV